MCKRLFLSVCLVVNVSVRFLCVWVEGVWAYVCVLVLVCVRPEWNCLQVCLCMFQTAESKRWNEIKSFDFDLYVIKHRFKLFENDLWLSSHPLLNLIIYYSDILLLLTLTTIIKNGDNQWRSVKNTRPETRGDHV